jgi:hypothetical protein
MQFFILYRLRCKTYIEDALFRRKSFGQLGQSVKRSSKIADFLRKQQNVWQQAVTRRMRTLRKSQRRVSLAPFLMSYTMVITKNERTNIILSIGTGPIQSENI